MIDVLSLGVGVQSSTLLFLADQGLIQPKPIAAVMADTKQEPAKVYRWLNFLQSLDLSIPILVRSYGDLGADNLRYQRSRKSGKVYSKNLIPLFIKNPNGSKRILPRRCTRDYKISVVQRTIRTEILGRRAIRKTSEPLVSSWIGISTDEADRMKPSNLSWIVNRWPLIDLGMSREDCKQWVRESAYYPRILAAGFTEPPRSACKQCPYHSDREWLRLREEEPEEFQAAVAWEHAYQTVIREHCETMKGVPFLHSSLVPLDQVVFNPSSLLEPFHNECEGMCGV